MIQPLTLALDEHPLFQSKWTGKGEVVPAHAKKEYSGSRGTAPLIFNPALDGDEWSTSRPGRFTPGKRTSIPFEPVWAEKSLAPVEIRTPHRPPRN